MSDFPFTLGPEGSTFPLSGNPYWSRVNLFQIQGATAKNYSIVGFKPGLPLQASELNEIQEIKAMDDTLTCTMISLWPIYLPAHSGDSPIYGPGWNGTTPLYPESNLEDTTENLVEHKDGIITVNKGWYLVTVKTSGMKHWIYLTTGYTASVPNASPDAQYFGFTAYYKTIKPVQDPSLYDNSTGINLITGAAAGADRIKVFVDAPFWTTNRTAEHFSPMIKKINNDTDLLYMNNVTVPEGTG